MFFQKYFEDRRKKKEKVEDEDGDGDGEKKKERLKRFSFRPSFFHNLWTGTGKKKGRKDIMNEWMDLMYELMNE